MVDIEKFKQSFNELLNSQKDYSGDPLFKVYNQFFFHDCVTKVNFSCFTLDEAEMAHEELCSCATEEDLDYEEDLLANEGNSFYEFCKMNSILWSELYSIPARKNVTEYF